MFSYTSKKMKKQERRNYERNQCGGPIEKEQRKGKDIAQN